MLTKKRSIRNELDDYGKSDVASDIAIALDVMRLEQDARTSDAAQLLKRGAYRRLTP